MSSRSSAQPKTNRSKGKFQIVMHHNSHLWGDFKKGTSLGYAFAAPVHISTGLEEY